MALNADKIKANEKLTGLSDDQISAIESLSANDEQATIDQRIGELHGRYDNDIKEVTGKEKPQGVKTYDHLKGILVDFKSKAEKAAEYETTVTTLQGKISTLEDQIKEGSTDKALKAKVDELTADLKNVQSQYNNDKSKWEQNIQEKETSIANFRIQSNLERVAAGLKYKPSDIIADDIRNLAINNAIKSLQEEYTIEEENGAFVFKDKNGAPKRNPNNNLQPYTADELLSEKLKSVLGTTENKPGGGTKPPKGGGNNELSISGATTQMEAFEMIEKHLLAKGLLKTSPEYQKEFDKLQEDNKILKLPVQ